MVTWLRAMLKKVDPNLPIGRGRRCGARGPRSRTSLACLGEFPLRLRRFRAGELEEMRGWDEAPTIREPAPLGAEIDDRRSLGPRRREPPAQLHQLDAVLSPSKYGPGLGRPDVVARLQIRSCSWDYHRGADLAESLQIGTVGHVIAEVVAHGQTLDYQPDSGPESRRTPCTRAPLVDLIT
jgi:hypothetical protein